MSSIIPSVRNGVGEIVLNRPKVLNALDQQMIDDMYLALMKMANDPAVETVLVTSSSERAFCAGGDVRTVRNSVLAGDFISVTRYFSSEYRLDQLIANYPKLYISLIDGVAMGGGLGISVHGEIRVVTEKALLAMPETAIGFFPDIGSTYFLPKLAAGVGRWLGLTGSRIRGTQALDLGLATHSVASYSVGALAEAIRSGMPLAEALTTLDAAPCANPLPLEFIADYFDGAYLVPELIRKLLDGDEWARDVARLMDKCSPTSLLVTAAMLEQGESSSLDECFDRELHAAERIAFMPDFAEGVRAVLVDKDNKPTFEPPVVDEVDPAVVARIIGK